MSNKTRPLDHEAAASKAAVLIESLTWLKKFSGKTIVIKFGGNAMVNENLMRSFAEDIVYLKHTGIKPVVVHGGGPQINAMLEKLGIESEFQGGYRVTTPAVMEVVRMVLTGKVNPQLIDHINEHGPLAAGISGEHAGLFTGRRKKPFKNAAGEEINLGKVGDIIAVNPEPVNSLLNAGLIPIVSSIAPEEGNPGSSLNINADSAASALAVALKAEKLVALTDVPGLYAQWPKRDTLIASLNANELEEIIPKLESGMVPKMRACLDAVHGGVPKAAIIDGREPHSVLLEIFTQNGIGTEVTP